jgi:hypothetical protein
MGIDSNRNIDNETLLLRAKFKLTSKIGGDSPPPRNESRRFIQIVLIFSAELR